MKLAEATFVGALADAVWVGWDMRGLRGRWGQPTCLEQVKAADDNPTIGLLLCKTKKRLVAEYALSGIDKPIGIAEYQLVRALPEPLDTCLPSIEEIEAALSLDHPPEQGDEV